MPKFRWFHERRTLGVRPLRALPWRGRIAAALLAGSLAACVTLTQQPRAVVLSSDGKVHVERLSCRKSSALVQHAAAHTRGLDPQAIRILTWNIHKQDDAGWKRDLHRFAARNDLILLQESVLDPDLRGILEGAGLQWTMASSFQGGDTDIGVITAARVAPIATCTERVVEPLLRLPKSAVISWFAIAGRPQTLAIANMHSINFSLSLGAYREQLAGVRKVLANHDGPIILAGDLNTWTNARSSAVQATAAALGLTEIRFADDQRRLFFGRHLDHIFVRGLAMDSSLAIPVTSSDHNPVQATLRLTPDGPQSVLPVARSEGAWPLVARHGGPSAAMN